MFSTRSKGISHENNALKIAVLEFLSANRNRYFAAATLARVSGRKVPHVSAALLGYLRQGIVVRRFFPSPKHMGPKRVAGWGISLKGLLRLDYLRRLSQ